MVRTKEQNRQRRKMHIRRNVTGTAARPRLTVFRSNQHIYAQLVDDVAHRTLAAASDVAVKGKVARIDSAAKVGKDLAAAALKQKIAQAIFDRSGYKFHGRVKSLAQGARDGGLKF